MTNMTKEAIEALQNLPKERQETAARAILEFASYDDDSYHLMPDERREIHAGVADFDRGDVATEREVNEVLKHIGV